MNNHGQPGATHVDYYVVERGITNVYLSRAPEESRVVVVTEAFNRLVREEADQQVARRTPTPKLSAREKYLRRQGRKA